VNVEAHLAAGWLLAHCGGNETRRFRGIVTLAAVIPDIDVVSYLGGIRAYSTYHHAAGHNLFFSLIVSVISIFAFRTRRLKIFLFTQLAFYSHYYGDYFFTRFPLEFFWPVSTKGFIYSYRIGLDHPVNLFLGYLSFVIIIVIGAMYHRTPMEFISMELDHRIVNLFRRKPLACHVCGGKSNERCATCDRPACMKHGRITRRFVVMCPECSAATPSQSAPV
jgi:hypothetical protein